MNENIIILFAFITSFSLDLIKESTASTSVILKETKSEGEYFKYGLCEQLNSC